MTAVTMTEGWGGGQVDGADALEQETDVYVQFHISILTTSVPV